MDIRSFGWMHGQPGAGLVIDVRDLPDPCSDPALRNLTGLDKQASDYVLIHRASLTTVTDIAGQVRALVEAVGIGRPRVQVWIGSAKGRHRSVAVVEAVAAHLREQGIGSIVEHRDCPL